MLTTLPKILFLADEIPQTKNAGSIQFYRIFEDYPPNNLLIVGRKVDSDANILKSKYIELNFKFADKLRTTRFHKLLPILETIGILKYSIPYEIRKEIDAFKPDIVVSIMQLYMYYSCAYKYAKSNNLPLYLFCHDDVEQFSNVPTLLREALVKKNKRIYQYAQKRLCISPQMAASWGKKYGAKGEVFYPIPDKNLTPRDILLCNSLRNNNRLTIGFAGSMAYGYAEGIKHIIPTLESSNTTLKIYNSPNKALKRDVSDCIEFCGYSKTAIETWERIKQDCDAVILPYSFDERFKQLYETHFPSKLPEYLSMGMPVIIIGPEYATGVIWGLEHPDAVLTSCDRNLDELSKITQSLISDVEIRKKYSENSIKYVSDFSPDKVKAKFYNYLLPSNL